MNDEIAVKGAAESTFTIEYPGLAYPFAMPLVVLRLLLICSLVLGGIGNAMATAAMPAMVDITEAAMATAAVAPLTASACAHNPGDPAPVAAPMEHPTPAAPHPANCDQDCCDQGPCNGVCMQLAQAALFVSPMLRREPDGAGVSAVFPAGHATPTLPNPIRPPIG